MKFNLPVIIFTGTVFLPSNEIKLEFDDEASKSIIEESELFHNGRILVVPNISKSGKSLVTELPNIGTVAQITKKLELPNGKIRVILRGLSRATVLEYLNPSIDTVESIVSIFKEPQIKSNIKSGIIRKLRNELENSAQNIPYISNSFLSLIKDDLTLGEITDTVVNHMPFDNKKMIKYLCELDPIKRAEMILEDIYIEKQLSDIDKSIDTKVKKEIDEDQKNFYLNEKIKHLKQELGEVSTKEREIKELREKLIELNIGDGLRGRISYEIDRYENMSSFSPETNMVRSYIELLISLPWNIYTKDVDDFELIKETLDKNHFGLDEVKDRILEYLAVKKNSNSINAPIICLVGPPGVGKTTLAHSIAQSMGRNFVKVSLGGVDDEAIIKGHIRTYLGSAPGKIINGIKRAKSSNPVFLIDEVDKMGLNYKGDPSSALLDVLDPTQNKYFKDNYLDEEYDLSKVLFITTANDIDCIPEALKDRLEIINIDGYTELEKLEIVKRYLIPNICLEHGISEIKISDENILEIIRFYTKEAGIRQLSRMISKIVRKIVADKIINNKRINLSVKEITKYLGRRTYDKDELTYEVGVVNGLAYTNYGGDIIPVETNYYKGNGNIVFTGSVGDITLESAKIALGYIKANCEMFGIDSEIFNNDIHINIPNIAIKKEGPSAGIAITTSIISALSNLKIKSNIAMTGEMTLRGNILKVGGLKEKIMSAHQNKIDTVFIPQHNYCDIDCIPEEIKQDIKFIFVKKYEEIYEYIKNNL